MKEISSMDFPQHGEVFYFYGQALNWAYLVPMASTLIQNVRFSPTKWYTYAVVLMTFVRRLAVTKKKSGIIM
jgi:hypothetical protein